MPRTLSALRHPCLCSPACRPTRPSTRPGGRSGPGTAWEAGLHGGPQRCEGLAAAQRAMSRRVRLARLLAMPLLMLLPAACCAGRVPRLPADPDHAPIALQEAVQLGGSRQWLLIRGSDRSKPLLLFLHGGPGSPYMGFAQQFQAALEQHFVVVQWDQRGAGKSYPGTPAESMTVQQFQSDTHELVLHLRRRFQRERLFLLGHSWGAYLGIHEAWRHPENLHAFVGTGQMIDLLEQERQSHRWAQTQARARHDDSAERELAGLGEPPYADTVRGMSTKYGKLWAYGGMMEGETGPGRFVRGMLGSPDYSLRDLYHFVRGSRFSLQQLARNEGAGFWSLQAPGPQPRFRTPIYFIAGEQDRVTPTSLVRAYAQSLEAPDKQVFLIPGAGHFAFYTHPERFSEAVLEALGRPRPGGEGGSR